MPIDPTARRDVRLFLAALVLFALFGLGASAALAADSTPTPRTMSRGNLVKVRPRTPQFPPDVKARGDRLWNAASPAVKAWASQNAPQVAKGPGDPEALAHAAARAPVVLTPEAAARPGPLSFLLLYEASEEPAGQERPRLHVGDGRDGSLRLQMAMDRLSKMMSTLSNLMKKMSTTQDAIIQNMK
ncbi:MAG: hypothetical protein IPL89_16120 [Acidobacteria bacterium]|nr:hypothetical protein [Acidobacteriota bacterium]